MPAPFFLQKSPKIHKLQVETLTDYSIIIYMSYLIARRVSSKEAIP